MNLHLSTSQLKPEVGESTHVLQVQGEGHTPVTFRVISMNILRFHAMYMITLGQASGRRQKSSGTVPPDKLITRILHQNPALFPSVHVYPHLFPLHNISVLPANLLGSTISRFPTELPTKIYYVCRI